MKLYEFMNFTKISFSDIDHQIRQFSSRKFFCIYREFVCFLSHGSCFVNFIQFHTFELRFFCFWWVIWEVLKFFFGRLICKNCLGDNFCRQMAETYRMNFLHSSIMLNIDELSSTGFLKVLEQLLVIYMKVISSRSGILCPPLSVISIK